jgi:hypothetical protein
VTVYISDADSEARHGKDRRERPVEILGYRDVDTTVPHMLEVVPHELSQEEHVTPEGIAVSTPAGRDKSVL